MKNIVLVSAFFLLVINKSQSQQYYDYNDTLYLGVLDVETTNNCIPASGMLQPNDPFTYMNFSVVDLDRLVSIPYSTNNLYVNNYHYWLNFGGYGHPSQPGQGFSACISRSDKNNIASDNFYSDPPGKLKFTNVRIPGESSNWGTGIWISLYSQCHSNCYLGVWWKYLKNLTADEARVFAGFHEDISAGSSVLNDSVILDYQGTASCNPYNEYGC